MTRPPVLPIGYNTTTDDTTAAIMCVQHLRNRSVRRILVCFTNADHVEIKSLTTVNQVYLLKYLTSYTPFNYWQNGMLINQSKNVMRSKVMVMKFMWILL